MIEHLSRDLYPLLSLSAYSYAEAQEHATWVDQVLGFQCAHVEAQIAKKSFDSSRQNWNHLSAQAFQTPYVELRSLLEILKLRPSDKIVDLGCAYGRMGLVLNAHYPKVHFLGFELESARVQEAQRIYQQEQVSSFAEVVQADLQSESFKLPCADVYFIFDYGTETAVRKTLAQIQEVALANPVQVVARGRLVRFLIHQSHPWLCEVQDPSHFPHFSIYRS